MNGVRFRDDIEVVLDDACGSDAKIARRAWAERPDQVLCHRKDYSDGWEQLIRALLKGRHGTPLEGGYLSVYVEAPASVWFQIQKHRFLSLGVEDFGTNLESGRYKVLDGEFYVPGPDRPIAEPDGFKPMRPELVSGTAFQRASVGTGVREVCGAAWREYEAMVSNKVSREVARLVLPFSVYYGGYLSANPRTWLTFFSLRKKDANAEVKSFPQYETQSVCEQCEVLFEKQWPLTYRLFVEGGRVAC